jgi:glycosyltransferase involved in cell wall biosynthesis
LFSYRKKSALTQKESPAPGVTVVIPWCDRPELSRTLAANAGVLESAGAEVVLVNCAGDDERGSQIARNCGVRDLKYVRLPMDSFNKSAALNLGVSVSSAPILLFLDADVILDDGFFRDGLSTLASSAYVRLGTLRESQPLAGEVGCQLLKCIYSLEIVTTFHSARIETSQFDFTDGSRSAPGIVLSLRADFLEVNGMNSDLTGWGWEDLDLLVRLQLRTRRPEATAGSGLHLTHNNSLRSSSEPHKADYLNFARCITNYKAGYWLGTCSDDIRTLKPRISVEIFR